MKKHLTVIIFAFVAFATTFLTSCSKEKGLEKPLSDQLSGQQTYELQNVSINGENITRYAAGQSVNGPEQQAFVELHLNSAGAKPGNTSTSKIYRDINEEDDLVFEATKTDAADAIYLSFNDRENFVASNQNYYQLPNELMQAGIIKWKSTGPDNGYYFFSPATLTGAYTIEKTTDGFRLKFTRPGIEIVMDLTIMK